jgi:hypothetical protein
MNLTATLTVGEISTLDRPHERIRDASQRFESTIANSHYAEEGAFEKSIRIKNTLDMFEDRSRTEPDWRVCATLINCEYQLWRLHADIPPQHNPFMSHWVEAIERLDSHGTSAPAISHGRNDITTESIDMARTSWIKTLLIGSDVDRYLTAAPYDIVRELLDRGRSVAFDLQVYVRMLEDEGIYEKTPEPEGASSSSRHSAAGIRTSADPKKARGLEHSYEDEIQQQKDNILKHIREQPEIAIFELTHLPINITYLDFLTTLLADHVLEKHSIDSAHIITQYIQHALRTVERMDKPPSPHQVAADDWSENQSEAREELEYGKEAQSRHILLLLLFIKSLIRKGLVELDVLYFEIAEITVRYVWIKEVREFRTWAEEGIGNDGAGR